MHNTEQLPAQMFCDEFIGEVIGIDLLREFRIVIHPGAIVVAECEFGRERPLKKFSGEGKTVGFALRDMRENVRMEYGR